MNKKSSRRTFLGQACAGLAGAAALGACATQSRAPGPAARPNLLFILSDDQRADALGCMGNRIIQTPHLDALAARGTLFENAFVTTPICMASRASFFTGQYVRTHGIDDFSLPLPEAQFAETYPARLRGAGYYTGFTGKWGLGGALPEAAFDWFRGYPGQGRYFPQGEPGPHLNAILGDDAVAFIEGCPRDRPFHLSVSFKAPHVQDDDPRQFLFEPDLAELYENIEIPPPHLGAESDFAALPEFVRSSENRKRWARRFATPEMYQTMVKAYYRLVTGMDRSIGRIFGALDRLGLADNTVIVFMADNGFYLGERGLAGKWLLHEESIRVPLIIADPRGGHTPRGQRVAAEALNIDIAPTLLAYAGVEARGMQGRDLAPWVHGETPDWRTECFFEHHFTAPMAPIPQSEGVRTRAWKYVRYIEHEPAYEELYHLAADPGETHNLAADPAERGTVERFRARWKNWVDALDAWQPDGAAPWRDPA